MSLGARLILRMCFGVLFVGGMLFVPAGSWQFWQGWVFLAIVSTASSLASLYLHRRDRQLLESRLRSKEKIREQKLLVRLLRLVFFVALVLRAWTTAWAGLGPCLARCRLGSR